MWDWIADHLALLMFITMFFVIFCGYPVAFVMGGSALMFAGIGWLARRVPDREPLEHPVAHVGRRRSRSGARLGPDVHLHGIDPGAVGLGQGHAARDRDPAEARARRACGRRDGDGDDPRGADRRGRRRGGAALGDRAAADAGVRLQQAARHRHDRVGRNARHSDPARHHAGGDGRNAQHLGRRAVRRRDHPGLSAVGTLSRLHHHDRDHQTRLGAEAPRRLRAADACRVLAHDVEGPLPHDLPDGRGARLDLRRLGDRDRKRGRRRVRLLRHRVAQWPPEAADGQRCDPRSLPCERDGVSDLPRRDGLLLCVPYARRRRPHGLDARDASASTPSGKCWRS